MSPPRVLTIPVTRVPRGLRAPGQFWGRVKHRKCDVISQRTGHVGGLTPAGHAGSRRPRGSRSRCTRLVSADLDVTRSMLRHPTAAGWLGIGDTLAALEFFATSSPRGRTVLDSYSVHGVGAVSGVGVDGRARHPVGITDTLFRSCGGNGWQDWAVLLLGGLVRWAVTAAYSRRLVDGSR